MVVATEERNNNNCNGGVEKEIIVSGGTLNASLEQSLGEYIFEKMKKHGDNVAQIYTPTGQSQTYTEVLTDSLKVAQELKHHGIGLGDVVSICTTNTPNSVYALLGSLFVGASINPLDPGLNKRDVAHLLSFTRPKLLFTERNSLRIIEEAIQELELTTEIVVFNPDAKNKYTTFAQFLEHDFETIDLVRFSNPHEHIAFLMSSSGTTGLPKVVTLSHANVLFQLKQQDTKVMPSALRILNMSTLFWISGIMVTLGGISGGIIRILTPPFDPEDTLQNIAKYKPYWVIVGVTFFARMVTHPTIDKYDLSAVRMLTIGGGKASESHIKKGEQMFSNVKIQPAYGLTESTGAALQLENAKPNSIGYLMPGLEAKIVDLETGKTLGPNKSGELRIRGPCVFKGYYRNLKSTSETVDSEGWLHTGDKVYYDEDKCFFIEGRMKEIIKCRGWQIAPLELETVLMNHPDIKEAAVVGVPHEIDVSRPRAFIVKRQNSEISENDVHEYMREVMNANKQITGGIVFLNSLPTTPTGKIQKRTLNEMVKQSC